MYVLCCETPARCEGRFHFSHNRLLTWPVRCASGSPSAPLLFHDRAWAWKESQCLFHTATKHMRTVALCFGWRETWKALRKEAHTLIYCFILFGKFNCEMAERSFFALERIENVPVEFYQKILLVFWLAARRRGGSSKGRDGSYCSWWSTPAPRVHAAPTRQAERLFRSKYWWLLRIYGAG
jgi:hypothetical protein